MESVNEAIASGLLPGRLWLYANFDCNLACGYCLTGSSPSAAPRRLGREVMLELARQARELGFEALGVTGGEPFLIDGMPALLSELSELLPLVVLSNGSLLVGAVLDELEVLRGRPVRLQLSIDSAVPAENDRLRGPGAFRATVEAIEGLRSRGLAVRVATTSSSIGEQDLECLRALLSELGVPPDEHVVRPVVRRGRARDHQAGLEVTRGEVPPELTITADGAFWGPFGPTVSGGQLATDLLVTPTILPLSVPAEALLELVQGRLPGEGARKGIR